MAFPPFTLMKTHRLIGCFSASFLLALTSLSSAAPSVTRLQPPVPSTQHNQTSGGRAASAKWLAMGSIEDSQQRGCVHLYNAVTGAYVRKLSDPAGANNDLLGTAVAVSGDSIIAGAPGRSVSGNGASGALVVFSAVTGKVLRTITTTNVVAFTGQQLGDVLAAEGDFIIAGCPNYSSYAGTAFVLRLSTGAFVTQLGVGAANDYRGYAVAISGQRVLVPAPFFDVLTDSVANGGKVDVMERDTGALIHTLTSPTANLGGAYGTAVAVEGIRALIGAPVVDGGRGRADLREITTGGVLAQLTPRDNYLDPSIGLGSSVAISGELAAVGLPGDGSVPGSVRLFDVSTPAGDELYTIPTPGTMNGEMVGQHLAVSSAGLFIGTAGYNFSRPVTYVVRGLASPLPGEILASTGDNAPGINGATYSAFTSTPLGRSGSGYALLATVKAGVGTPVGATKGLWIDTALGYRLAARTGTIFSQLGNSLSDISAPQINTSDHVHYNATAKGPAYPSGSDSLIGVGYQDGSASIRTPYTSGLFGIGTVVLSTASSSQGNGMSNHDIALIAKLKTGAGGTTAANDSGIAISNSSSGSQLKAVREGEVVALDTLGQINRLQQVQDAVIFQANVVGSTSQALYKWDRMAQTTQVIARANAGNPIPNATTSAILSETSRPGRTLYRVSLKGVPTTSNEALFEWAANSTSLLWQKGSTGGVGSDVIHDKLLGYWQSGISDTLLWVSFKGIPPNKVSAANDGCLLRRAAVGPDLVLLREGDPAPGIPGAQIGVIQRIDVDADSACYVALVSLTGATKGMDQALYTGYVKTLGGLPASAIAPDLLLQKGRLIDGGFYGDATVTGISLTTTSVNAGGAGQRTPAIIAELSGIIVNAVVSMSDGKTKVMRLQHSSSF
jgi:hypothetical protein